MTQNFYSFDVNNDGNTNNMPFFSTSYAEQPAANTGGNGGGRANSYISRGNSTSSSFQSGSFEDEPPLLDGVLYARLCLLALLCVCMCFCVFVYACARAWHVCEFM